MHTSKCKQRGRKAVVALSCERCSPIDVERPFCVNQVEGEWRAWHEARWGEWGSIADKRENTTMIGNDRGRKECVCVCILLH